MCRKCQEKREALLLIEKKKENIRHWTNKLKPLLYEDKIKGSEFKRLTDMLNSNDEENHQVVYAIVEQKQLENA